MATQKKVQLVEEYTKRFKEAKSIFFTDFSGINVSSIDNLRRVCRDAGVEYRVIKNTLAKRSLKNAGIDGLDDILKGVTAFAYSDKDAVAPIKIIKEYNKELTKINKSLILKGAIFEGKIIGPENIEFLANLPSREELLAKFLAMMQSPLANLARTLKATGQNLVSILIAVQQKKTQ
jgi:large subunit ribosomal protein L10